MMKCPICRSSSHTRTSRYITDQTKEIYYQCQNINCSATFKTSETIDKVISTPRKDHEQEKRITQISKRI
ncbi:ogr/Delta-like zinc finger family protein [Acinetobacter nectaris]|uniref:ogr/Delta-like zinc finger family protein n=1 Tax=Acinetobacter nectaris TaxID=1219382 RepID=UPI0009D779BF|nr:ogr/Delta-like zinc finger family protein [Acinetobacter nectaris]